MSIPTMNIQASSVPAWNKPAQSKAAPIVATKPQAVGVEKPSKGNIYEENDSSSLNTAKTTATAGQVSNRDTVVDSIGNTVAQVGHILPSAVKSLANMTLAPGVVMEKQISEAVEPILNDTGSRWAAAQTMIKEKGEPFLTQADLIDARAAGDITPEQYNNTISQWQAGDAPLTQAEINRAVRDAPISPMKAPEAGLIEKAGRKIDQTIDKATNSVIPAPSNPISQLSNTTAKVLGYALPSLAMGLLTGGGSLAGNAASWGVGAAGAMGNELIERDGSLKSAAIVGGSAFVSEAAGAKMFGNGPLLKGAFGEGAEEIIDGIITSVANGEPYSLDNAGSDFLTGGIAGLVLGSAADGINVHNDSVIGQKVEKAVNEKVDGVVTADLNDIQELLAHGGDSAASAVVAHDSLVALQKQTANPDDSIGELTTDIPADIAEKFNLIPSSDNPDADPIVILKKTYESQISPEVAKLSAPEVSQEDRATVDPKDAAVTNPRALYQYAPDIYLRPGTNTNLDDTLFTYRGQENQFYRTSQDVGSIPASGRGTSWEGSGVYSAFDTYTTDLYGPSGMLPDNPYRNGGIPQGVIGVDYPVGVVLQQPAGLSEDISPLRRHDAPDDAVGEGTRRVRFDDRGLNFITEVVNNPNDISAAGLIFGRTTMNEAIPIEYARKGAASEPITVVPETIANLEIAAKQGTATAPGTISDPVPTAARGTAIEPMAVPPQRSVPEPGEATASETTSVPARAATGLTDAVSANGENTDMGNGGSGTLQEPPALGAGPIGGGMGVQYGEYIIPDLISPSALSANRYGGNGWVQGGTDKTETAPPSEETPSLSEKATPPSEPAPSSSEPEAQPPAIFSTTGDYLGSGEHIPEGNAADERNAETGQEARPEVAPGVIADIGMDAERHADAKPDENSGTESEPSSDANENTEPDSQAEPNSNSDTEKKPQAEAPPEDRARQIWTPLQEMAEEQKKRKKEKIPHGDSSILRGNGSTGEIYATRGYNDTFGGLSSFKAVAGMSGSNAVVGLSSSKPFAGLSSS